MNFALTCPMRGSRALVIFPKLAAADIPARIHELRMVENIEEFTPNLEHLGLGDWDRLLKPEIGVVEAGAVEESPIRGAEGATIRAWGGPR